MRQIIKERLSDFVQILEAVAINHQVLVKAKAKFEPFSALAESRR